MYTKQNGDTADVDVLILAGSAARVASADGDGVETDRGTLCLTLDVTAKTGTAPTLDITIATSEDNSTWRTLSTFSQVANTTGSYRKSFAGADRYSRASWTIGGSNTPGFTFSVSGEMR